ncbi:NADH dehydrogenase FAD-containing subunit [Catenulispora sp. GP43]|uniref:FAD-dependent oxidoreductase n=1 Tax=Catenulispora sp. GP43 TaxID=3156263 RepID=UPI003513A555
MTATGALPDTVWQTHRPAVFGAAYRILGSVADGREIGYDRLVLAAGSSLPRPRDLPGAERLFDIESLDGARRLTEHLRGRDGFHAVVVGAGFTGLEAAAAFDAEHTVM